MDTDIHLDTSWCPVCDCAILPKRYTVPINPQPTLSTTAVKSSQTTRGKNGTIKARAGGLVQGTGRVRPGLNRATTSKAKSPLRADQQQLLEENTPVRTRTVIDQAQTPLYCSEECRKRDLEESWPVAPPPARAVLDTHRRSSRIRLGAHPAQINPARASPPPPSPTLPPVPPNSWRAPRTFKARDLDLDLAELTAGIQEVDEHSDSSSASGTSFTASDRSPIEERDLIDNSNLYTDPAPPPLAPLPPHPHRPSAPVVPPKSGSSERQPLFEGGIMMAAKRLKALIASGAADDDRTRAERREREEQQRKEEARMRRWDLTGEMARSSSNDREKKKQPKQESPPIDPTRWTELVYNYNTNSSATSSSGAGVPSTHRRASDSDPATRIRAPGAPNRTQSALELYAKYPLFARSTSSTTNGKSSASLATSYAPAYGATASSSASTRSSASSVSARTAGASALTLPGADPALYAGKRLGGPRRAVAKGVEGRLLVPDVLLRPAVPVSSSLPSGIGGPPSQSTSMRRSGSEASVNRRNGRSASTLGAVREGEGEGEGDGMWHRPDEGSEDSRSSVTRSSASGQESRSRKGKKSRSSKSGSKRSVAEEPNWSYENSGPVYDAMPSVPVKQTRYEEVFLPDAQTENQSSASEQEEYIDRSPLHARDVELSRRAVREVGRRRGEHKGRAGWWVEKEWEVTVIPERKKLFLFGGGTGAGRRV